MFESGPVLLTKLRLDSRYSPRSVDGLSVAVGQPVFDLNRIDQSESEKPYTQGDRQTGMGYTTETKNEKNGSHDTKQRGREIGIFALSHNRLPVATN